MMLGLIVIDTIGSFLCFLIKPLMIYKMTSLTSDCNKYKYALNNLFAND